MKSPGSETKEAENKGYTDMMEGLDAPGKPTAAAPAPGAPSETLAPSPSTHSRRFVPVGVFLLFALSFAVSWFTKASPPPAPVEVGKASEKISFPHPPQADKKPVLETNSLARGDDCFRQGRFDLALGHYQKLAAPGQGKSAPLIALRLGLCHEEMGQAAQAHAQFLELVRQGTPGVAQAGVLGQARLLMRRRQFTEAKDLLWPLFFQAEKENVPEEWKAATQYLLSLTLAQEQWRTGPIGPFDLEMGWPNDLPWHTEQFLTTAIPSKAEPGGDKEILTVAPAQKNAPPLVVEARCAAAPIKERIDQLAQAAGWKVAWSPVALAAAQKQTASLHLSQRSLTSVLQGLAERADAACQVEEGVVKIFSREELTKEQLGRHAMQQAVALLEETLGKYPQHPLAAGACLALGTLQARVQPSQGIAWFEQLAQTQPHFSLSMYAHFQRGHLLERLGDEVQAQKAYFQVVDGAPGHPLAAVAYLRLGRMHLEERQQVKAITLLRRADAHAVDPGLRNEVALHLAMAHTLSEDPSPVRTVLAKRRDHWVKDSHRRLAAFLEAYAPFRQAALRQNKLPASEDLLVALMNLGDDPPDVLAQHVAGLACCDLALWDQGAARFALVQKRAVGPLRQEATFRLAYAQVHQKKVEEARRQFTSLLERKNAWTPWAEFHLAALDLQGDEAKTCLARCRRLTAQTTALPLPEVLNMMGRAYEKLGNHQQAALCYAGKVPSEP